MSQRVHVIMPAEMVSEIDGLLGPGQSRGDFVRRAVTRDLESRGKTPIGVQPVSGAIPTGVERADAFRRAAR